MQDLKVIGVEDGAIVAATENGERFRLVIDEVLQSHVRRNRRENAQAPKVSPREVQTHIRSGLSAEEVATLTGAELEYVQRFEGPVMAEREHIVAAALSVQVLRTTDTPDDDSSFGAAIRARLESLGANGERWTSWKEQEGGWIVKLSFTASEIDHDARWSFEPKKLVLAPLNAEAITLSKQGELPAALIPRLRAVELSEANPDDSRFDSGAFNFRDNDEAPDFSPSIELPSIGRAQSSSKAATAAAINRAEAPAGSSQSNETADLLEALRKRRGERESAQLDEIDESLLETQRAPRLLDVPLADFDELPSEEPVADAPAPAPRGNKRGRTAMPSWDEIVFGAKSDED